MWGESDAESSGSAEASRFRLASGTPGPPLPPRKGIPEDRARRPGLRCGSCNGVCACVTVSLLGLPLRHSGDDLNIKSNKSEQKLFLVPFASWGGHNSNSKLNYTMHCTVKFELLAYPAGCVFYANAMVASDGDRFMGSDSTECILAMTMTTTTPATHRRCVALRGPESGNVRVLR